MALECVLRLQPMQRDLLATHSALKLRIAAYNDTTVNKNSKFLRNEFRGQQNANKMNGVLVLSVQLKWHNVGDRN